jgi:UDP-N-acetylmuramate--alanine ligase
MPQAAIDNARDGDVLMCMGAGSIGAVPGKIVELLQNQELLAQQGRAL